MPPSYGTSEDRPIVYIESPKDMQLFNEGFDAGYLTAMKTMTGIASVTAPEVLKEVINVVYSDRQREAADKKMIIDELRANAR